MKETQSKQKTFKVRLYRDFEFPSFSIDSEDIQNDLLVSACDEIKENINDNKYFSVEVLKILPFSLIKEVEKPLVKVDVDFFIKNVVVSELESKYGELDSKKNPDIYVIEKEKENEVKNKYIKVSYPTLKPEIEEFFHERILHYYKIFESK